LPRTQKTAPNLSERTLLSTEKSLGNSKQRLKVGDLVRKANQSAGFPAPEKTSQALPNKKRLEQVSQGGGGVLEGKEKRSETRER